MNDIIKAVEDLDVDTLIEKSPTTAMYTVDTLEVAIEDQIRELIEYREQLQGNRQALVAKLQNPNTIH
jgi:hypothetical protein